MTNNNYLEKVKSDVKIHQIESYGYYHSFLKFAYNFLNGEVNTNIRAMNLVIQSLENGVAGYSHSFIVSINLPIIYNKSTLNNFSDKEVKGAIIYILIHELSHCDQNIDILRLSRDEEYRKNIEFSNNQNTIRFIKENAPMLFCTFGQFYIPDDLMLDFLNQKKYYKNRPHFEYEQAISIKNQFLMVLEGWTQLFIRKCLEDPKNNITNFDLTLKFLLTQNNKKEEDYTFKIISSNVFVVSTNVLNALSKLLTIAVFKYRTPEIRLNDNNTYLNIVVRIYSVPQIYPVEFVE